MWQPKATVPREEAKIDVKLAAADEPLAKPVLFEDPAIVAFQKTEVQEESKAGLPSLQFAPLASDLKPSAEFQKFMAEINNSAPATIQDMLNVLGSLQGTSQDASSKS